MKRYTKPAGHSCGFSKTLDGFLAFGTGKLDKLGYFANGCAECARAYDAEYSSEDGVSWPFPDGWKPGIQIKG